MVVVCLVAAAALPAQSGNFDDLARRASDAIDTSPEQAALLYGQALALRPDWAEGWLYRGAALFQLHRYAEARDSLRKGAALDPSKGTPFAFLGLVEYELGDYPAALSDILKGEDIGLPDRPDFVREVRYHGALIYLRSSDFGDALKQLSALAKRSIQSDEVNTALGLSALGLPYLPSTLPADRLAVVNLAGRAAWAFLADRESEARALFDQLRTQFPNEAGVHYMTGVFLISRNPLEAQQEFRKELALTPSHVLARVQLSDLLKKDGNIAESLQFAAAAARLAPGDPLCQTTFGRALLDSGRNAEAITALEKAEKLAPKASRVHFYLVQAYRRAGRNADAQREKVLWDQLHAEEQPPQIQ